MEMFDCSKELLKECRVKYETVINCYVYTMSDKYMYVDKDV